MTKFQIAIPSRGRPENVKKLLEITSGVESKPLFFIPNDEYGHYSSACPEADYVCLKPYKNLAQKRNIILSDIKENYKESDIVMMDDDLQSIHMAVSKKKMIPYTFANMIDYIQQSLTFHKLKLAGVPQIASLFYFNPKMPFSVLNFVVSNIYYIRKDNELRFDENLDVKSDYDFTLQNIFKYGGALRCNCILAKFEHWNNSGGLTGIRTNGKSMKAIEYLEKKWGKKIIRRNSREGKETEILLKVPVKR